LFIIIIINPPTNSLFNRAQAATDCNTHSSRSHLIVQVDVLTELIAPPSPHPTPAGDVDVVVEKWHGKLNLIDLAGSERLAQSHVRRRT
jgi:hypothetical protein